MCFRHRVEGRVPKFQNTSRITVWALRGAITRLLDSRNLQISQESSAEEWACLKQSNFSSDLFCKVLQGVTKTLSGGFISLLIQKET